MNLSNDVNSYPPLNNPSYIIQNDTLPTVIWWTKNFYPHEKNDTILHCPLGKCHVTNSRDYQSLTSTRAFVFYGSSFRADDVPLPRLPNHEWALLHEESPKNNWMFSDPLGIR